MIENQLKNIDQQFQTLMQQGIPRRGASLYGDGRL